MDRWSRSCTGTPWRAGTGGSSWPSRFAADEADVGAGQRVPVVDGPVPRHRRPELRVRVAAEQRHRDPVLRADVVAIGAAVVVRAADPDGVASVDLSGRCVGGMAVDHGDRAGGAGRAVGQHDLVAPSGVVDSSVQEPRAGDRRSPEPRARPGLQRQHRQPPGPEVHLGQLRRAALDQLDDQRPPVDASRLGVGAARIGSPRRAGAAADEHNRVTRGRQRVRRRAVHPGQPAFGGDRPAVVAGVAHDRLRRR